MIELQQNTGAWIPLGNLAGTSGTSNAIGQTSVAGLLFQGSAAAALTFSGTSLVESPSGTNSIGAYAGFVPGSNLSSVGGASLVIGATAAYLAVPARDVFVLPAAAYAARYSGGTVSAALPANITNLANLDAAVSSRQPTSTNLTYLDAAVSSRLGSVAAIATACATACATNQVSLSASNQALLNLASGSNVNVVTWTGNPLSAFLVPTMVPSAVAVVNGTSSANSFEITTNPTSAEYVFPNSGNINLTVISTAQGPTAPLTFNGTLAWNSQDDAFVVTADRAVQPLNDGDQVFIGSISTLPATAEVVVTPLRVSVNNPSNCAGNLPAIPQESTPSNSFVVVDSTGATVNLSAKTLRLTGFTRVSGTNAPFDDLLTQAWQYANGSGIVVSGTASNIATLTHAASNTANVGPFEYEFWNVTDNVVIAAGKCPIVPSVPGHN